MLVSAVKWSQHLYNDRFKKFSQLIFKVSIPETITFMYKLDHIFTDDTQNNYLW